MRTETVIVGGGQAGLSLSHHLAQARHPHVVLERGRIGERWRSERWDSLTLLTPNWLNRLDGAPPHADEDGFLTRDGFVRYLERYAAQAPVREHVEVQHAEQTADGGFRVVTSAGTWLARNVVVATGDSADPRVPRLASPVRAIHSVQYRNPASIAAGGVLVVGAGPSGQQLAAELARAGRRVVLAVGGHGRMVRRYRGRDIWWWLRELGDLEQRREPDAPRPRSLTVTGANGGEQLDLAVLDALGVELTGRLERFDGLTAHFADDLPADVADAERRLTRVLERIDERFPEWPHEADRPAPVALPPAAASLGLAGIETVIWATGYTRSYPWLHADVFDGAGEIVQRDGVTPLPGLYILGRNFQSRRSSHFIGGVGRDAAFIAALLRWKRSRVGDPARHPFLQVVAGRHA
jgi:putative flavoprotein involved in K+ transport